MIHNIYRLRKVLNFVYQCLFACLFMLFFCVIMLHVPVKSAYFVEIVLIYFISYIVRDLAPNLLLALSFHVIPFVGIYFYGMTFSVFVVMAMIGFRLFMDTWMYMRMGRVLKPVDDMPWPVFLMSFIFFLFGYYVKNDMLKSAAYHIPLICVAIYLLNVYLDGLIQYVNSTKNVSGLPMKNIVRTNSLFVGVVIAVLLVAAVLGNSIDFTAVLTAIKNVVVTVVKVIFSGIAFIINLIMKLFSAETAVGTGDTYTAVNKPRENNFAAGESILVLLQYALLAVLIYVAVKIIIKIVKALLVKQQGMLDIVEEAEVEKNLVTEAAGIKRIWNTLFSPEEKLRKMYKKYILGYSYDIRLKNSSTCGEIQQEVMEKTNEDVSDVTKLYSDVRYGGKNVSREDLKRIKQLTQKR
ncbi:MAG: hypothetical protein NC225_01960 [Clostridium sp.]|nr:hypothetical protein [Clostridium sp.]MCM1398227.1 hypothetical protein [Clostridium sp.]MCM1460359.1 hypothetical protein [Bacteroides sp.]